MELEVTPARAGERLDAFLAEAVGSRARAQRLIEAGRVTVDAVSRAKRHTVSAGERILIQEPEGGAVGTSLASEHDVSFEVAFEDDHLLVVDKPAGVVVHPGRGNQEGTLAQALSGRAVGGDDPMRAGIVHRLDRQTSGLLVVAKSETAHRALRAALAARDMRREYQALVNGRPTARTGTIDAPIGRDRRVRTLMSTDTDVPREARTHFEIEEALPGCTLLRVRLDTGRTHQIRVHLQAIGHPVCGDPEYGGGGRLGLERQFLHAVALAFPHPISGAPVDVRSPLPPDLTLALARARAGES